MQIAGNERRSTNKVRMVREVIDSKGNLDIIDAWMPCGLGWNRGNDGPLDLINMGIGWRTYDEYMAERHSAEVTAKLAEIKEKVASKPSLAKKEK